jgi:hypothetical protein
VADLSPIVSKLAKTIRLLGSDRDGDHMAAVAALKRMLEGIGADFNDFARLIELNDEDKRAILDAGIAFGKKQALEEQHAGSNGHTNGASSFNGATATTTLCDMVTFCHEHVEQLSREKDREFIRDVFRRGSWRWGASPKQRNWIEDLYYQLGGQ